MARNREFDDALDELKMLHDAKNHDYATAEHPYKNLEGVARIGIEPWRGIVIRMMDKFSRLEEFCKSGELAIKSEGIEDTFKDISVYSTLAMILFRKSKRESAEKQQEIEDTEALREGLELVEKRKSDEISSLIDKRKEKDGDDATQELTEAERGKDADNDEDKFWAEEIKKREDYALKAVMKWRENGAIS